MSIRRLASGIARATDPSSDHFGFRQAKVTLMEAKLQNLLVGKQLIQIVRDPNVTSR